VKQFGYVITDTSHKVYYTSRAFSEHIKTKTSGKDFFSLLYSPSGQFSKEMILCDIDSEGYFNGYIQFNADDMFWFCDYGKRYDNNGKHIGYDVLVHQVNSELGNYMEHFYNNLKDKLNNDSISSMLDAYIDEKQMLSQMTNISFPEFMTALQDQYE